MLILLVGLAACGAHATDWPHWRGPARNAVTDESSGWSAGHWAIAEQWRTSAGTGSSSVLVIGDRLYTLGWRDGQDTVICLDTGTGKPIWRQSYACAKYGRHATGDQGFYAGPSATPEFDAATEYLYTVSIDGHVHCWDTAAAGKAVWQFNMYDRYGVGQRPQITRLRGSQRDYGYPQAPLVHGDWLLVEVGDDEGNVMAFDKRTGERRWSSENRDPAGHTGGPMPMTVDGIPCLMVLTARNLVAMRLDGTNAGKTIGETPWATDFVNNIPTPAVIGNRVIVTSKYNITASAAFEVSLGGLKQLWLQRSASGVCSPVTDGRYVYWANRGLWCLDLATGRDVWDGGKFGDAGSMIVTGDHKLIVWSNDGDLSLVEAATESPREFTLLAEKLHVFNDMAWPHVVLANGRLFCRDRAGNLAAFAVSGNAATTALPPESVAPTAVATDLKLTSWPGDDKSMIISWRCGQSTRSGSMLERGEARFADGAMAFAGGTIECAEIGETLAEACRQSGELSIEVLLASASAAQEGPARAVSFSTDPYHRNFTLGQENGDFIIRLRTSATDENGIQGQFKLGQVTPGKSQYLTVTYRDADLRCFLDGKQVFQTDRLRGDLMPWSAQRLVFGNEADGSRPWKGTIQAVAVHSRIIPAVEVAARLELLTVPEPGIGDRRQK